MADNMPPLPTEDMPALPQTDMPALPMADMPALPPRATAAPAKPKPDHSSMTVGPDGSIYYRDPQARKEFRQGVESGAAGMASGVAQRPLGIAQYVTSYLPEALGGNKAGDKLAEWERSLQAVGDPKAQQVGGGIFDVATLEPVLRLGGAALQGAKNLPATISGLFTKTSPKAAGAVAEAAPKVAEAAEALTPDKVTKLNTALDTLKDYSVKSMKSGATGGLAGYFQGATTARGEKTEEERTQHRRIDELWGTVIGAGIGLPLPAVLEGGPAAWRQLTGKNLTEARTALEQYLEDVRKAITGKTGEAIGAETAKGATEAEALAAAQAKLTPQQQEAARAQRALEEIEKGRGKEVPVGRSDTGEIVTGTRAEAQAFDPSALSETQRGVYTKLTQESAQARQEVERLRAQTDAQNPKRQEQLAEQFANLRRVEGELNELNTGVVAGTEQSGFGVIPPGLSLEEQTLFKDYQTRLASEADARITAIKEAERGDPTKRTSFDQFATDVRAAVDDTKKVLETEARSKSGLAKLDEKYGDQKAFSGRNVINELERLKSTSANPTVRANLDRQINIIKDEMDGAGRVTFSVIDDTQKVLNDAYNSGIVASAGAAKSAGGAGAQVIKEARDFVRKEIGTVEPEFEKLRQEYAKLMEPLDPYKEGGIFDKIALKELHGYSLNDKEVVKQFIDRANAGQPGLADLVAKRPEMKEAARAYFNGQLFGTEIEKEVSTKGLNSFLTNNEKVLKELGLYNDFKDLKVARDIAKEQADTISRAQKETQRVYNEARTAERVVSGAETEAKKKAALADIAESRVVQVAKGTETPSILDPAKTQVPGGVKYQSPEDVRKAQIRGKGLKPVDIEAKTRDDIARLEKQQAAAQGNVQELTKIAQTAEREMNRANKAVSDLTRFQSRVETTRPKELISRIDGYLNEMSTDIIDDQAYRALREQINTAKAEYERLQDAEKFSFRVRAVLGSLLTGYAATASGFGRFLHSGLGSK
jgi:hypothetical protein